MGPHWRLQDSTTEESPVSPACEHPDELHAHVRLSTLAYRQQGGLGFIKHFFLSLPVREEEMGEGGHFGQDHSETGHW